MFWLGGLRPRVGSRPRPRVSTDTKSYKLINKWNISKYTHKLQGTYLNKRVLEWVIYPTTSIKIRFGRGLDSPKKLAMSYKPWISLKSKKKSFLHSAPVYKSLRMGRSPHRKQKKIHLGKVWTSPAKIDQVPLKNTIYRKLYILARYTR